MLFFVLLLVGIGILCICASIWGMTTNTSGERLLIVAFGGISFILAFVYLFLELLVVRRFPKYTKLRRILFNSDIYFADSTSNEYFGRSRTLRGRMNKAAFDMVTHIAEQNKDLEGIKYPKTYVTFIILTIAGIFFIFFNILVACLALENLSALPLVFQSEGVVFAIFISLELADLILSFVFAFRVKKIREITIDEYRAEQRKKKESDKQK